jgi:hypothetical protein
LILNRDGSDLKDAYQGNSDRFPGESRNNDRLPECYFDLDQQQIKISANGKLEFRKTYLTSNAENLSG